VVKVNTPSLLGYSLASPTLYSIGSTTSDSPTPLGTVLIIRSNRLLHVLLKSCGLAMLDKGLEDGNKNNRNMNLCMVKFPSLEKIRRSELVVALGPTTKGLFVVPSRYSITLAEVSTGSDRSDVYTTYTLLSKAVVESNVARSTELSCIISGKSSRLTPPMVCPHATSPIISDSVKP
jgi:hypothetical protein